ncbi:hypothetical protein WJX74_002253 [Apatococcus lobatus]|uniref:Uncharacterized protein n=1 Tax=Apatococcus lobatus TaxID=904363 RepID=A0AAW1S6A1_9CHLO
MRADSTEAPSELTVEVLRTYRQLKRLLWWRPLAGIVAALVLIFIGGILMGRTSDAHDAMPGRDQQQMAFNQTGGIQGLMGQRLPYDPNATNDLSDMAIRLMVRHGETTPEEREQQEAEARLQKELEEAERLREAEIDSHAEKPWKWMRDPDKEHREGDFLVAMSSRAEHLEVVRAGRKWRQGMRTVIGLDREPTHTEELEAKRHNEIWIFYPGDKAAGAWAAGASRSAMMPILAHKAVEGEYRWILYGEEDTVFFVDALQQLLKGYDWHLPYSLTDRGFSRPTALRCLPCHAPDSMNPPSDIGRVFGMAVKKKPLKGVVPRGCPCTPDLLCQVDPYHEVFSEECAYPAQRDVPYSPQSGSGMLLSHGLVQGLNMQFFERCVQSDQAAGSHQILSSCLWEAGHAHTDPSTILSKQNLDLFDVSVSKATLALASALDKTCDASCQDMIANMVSAHISIRTSGPEASAHTLESLARLYNLVIHAKPRTNITP